MASRGYLGDAVACGEQPTLVLTPPRWHRPAHNVSGRTGGHRHRTTGGAAPAGAAAAGHLPSLRRWTRVLRSSLRCFFFDIRLRRFLITEPMRRPFAADGGARPPRTAVRWGSRPGARGTRGGTTTGYPLYLGRPAPGRAGDQPASK